MNASQFVDTSGLDHMIAFLQRLGTFDPMPALVDCGRIMVEGNRAGVLAGLNAAGQPATPALRYRMGGGKPTAYRRNRFAQQRSPGAIGGKAGTGAVIRYRSGGGKFKPTHRGTQTTAANNNLTTSEYRKLTGPFAAPRREHSRIITNFKVQTPLKMGDDLWVVKGGWSDVVDTRGREFYQYLFRPSGRDYRGIRPTDMIECRDIIVKWVHHWIAEARAAGA